MLFGKSKDSSFELFIGLNKRDHQEDKMNYSYQPQPQYQVNIDYLKQQVLEKLSLGLIIATIISGLVVFTNASSIFIILAFGGEIISIIGYFFARNERTIESLYYIFVASSATILGYVFQSVLAILSNGIQIITLTFGITAVVVGFFYYRASTRTVDTNSLGRKLMPFGIIFIVLLIASLFISFGALGYLLFSIFGAVLFSLYLYFDLGRLENKQYTSPARMAWSIYWDILIVFQYILEILVMLMGERN